MKLFEHLTTVPLRLQKVLRAKHALEYIPPGAPASPIDTPYANGYRSALFLETDFWVDPSLPGAMEVQLRISKAILLRHLYGDVLDQLLPIKRAIANGDTQEAFKLVEELERSIFEE